MQKLLIVGCGDVARRALPLLVGHYRVFALLRDAAQAAEWRAAGATPLIGDLDKRRTLKRFAGLAGLLLHFAPPPGSDPQEVAVDARTRNLLAALASTKSLPQRLVYISTSGVYGDCAGCYIDETRPVCPATARAARRVDAERRLRRFAQNNGVVVSILRAPGIYAADRLPLERLQKQTPALRDEDDVFTNHIHADDLARLACAALRYGRANRIYNACDDSGMKMGEYFDRVAERFALPRAPRLSRREALAQMSPLQLSFMSESRRLLNGRAKRELHFRFRYPRVENGIEAAWQERNRPCS